MFYLWLLGLVSLSHILSFSDAMNCFNYICWTPWRYVQWIVLIRSSEWCCNFNNLISWKTTTWKGSPIKTSAIKFLDLSESELRNNYSTSNIQTMKCGSGMQMISHQKYAGLFASWLFKSLALYKPSLVLLMTSTATWKNSMLTRMWRLSWLWSSDFFLIWDRGGWV